MSTPTPTLPLGVEVVIEAHLEEVEVGCPIMVINNWPLSDHSAKVVEGSASQTGEEIIIMGEDQTEFVVEVPAQECHHFLRLSAGWE